MPTTFPGMDPFIEQDGLWPDFHTTFIAGLKSRLVAAVRPKYIVLAEHDVYLHEPADEERRVLAKGDVAPARAQHDWSSAPASGGAVIEAPCEVELTELEFERVPYLEIRDRARRDLVTVIELLSPSNKRGAYRDQYLQKRMRLLRSPAHFVEVDLLRGGPPLQAEGRPECRYSVLVSRAEDRPRAGYWPVGLKVFA